jgi:hypothetical protein
MKRLTIYLTTILFCLHAEAQQKMPSCSSPEAAQFDFWLGKWELTWNDSSKGTNEVEKILGNCVIQENFNDPASVFCGKSWSTYNPAKKEWQQTWVDNQGGYIVLTGKFSDHKMILSTIPFKNEKGEVQMSEMVFYNITKDSFDWNWEKSNDSGKSWVLNWKIHYQRKNALQ